jgi:biotin carboxyl carrier protein
LEEKKNGEYEMRKYFIEKDKEEKLIGLSGDDKAFIDGEEYKYSFEILGDEYFLLRLNNENYFLKIIKDDNDPGAFFIENRAELYRVTCRDELSRLIEEMGYGNKNERHHSEIRSPMPGIIVKLNVSEGQNIKQGDVLLVLEAMKMENEIMATRDCIVAKINVVEKRSVEKGELLMILE